MSGPIVGGKRPVGPISLWGSVENVILARPVNKWLSFKSLPFSTGITTEGGST
jgi:hypothetical protein